jgi:polar amino acid transport system substrate-binding protein
MHVVHSLFLVISVVGVSALTASESEPPLRVGADVDYAPFSHLSEGDPAGFDVAFLEMVLKRLDREAEYVLRPWAEVHDLARTAQLDLVLGVVYTPDREDYLDFTDPYNTFRFAVLTRPDSSIRSVTDLQSRRLAHLEGDVVAEILVEAHDIAPVFVPHSTLSDAVASVRSGLADGAIAPWEWTQSAENADITRELILVSKDALTSTYRIGVVRPDTAITEELNRAIAAVMASPEYDALRVEWFGESLASSSPADHRETLTRGVAIGVATAIAAGILLFLAVLIHARRLPN